MATEAPLSKLLILAGLIRHVGRAIQDGTTVDGDGSQFSPSPLRVSVLPRAPHGRWATRAGRSPGLRLQRLAPTFPMAPRRRDQWYSGEGSPLTVAGAATVSSLAEVGPFSHRVPFSPGPAREAPTPGTGTMRNYQEHRATVVKPIREMA